MPGHFLVDEGAAHADKVDKIGGSVRDGPPPADRPRAIAEPQAMTFRIFSDPFLECSGQSQDPPARLVCQQLGDFHPYRARQSHMRRVVDSGIAA